MKKMLLIMAIASVLATLADEGALLRRRNRISQPCRPAETNEKRLEGNDGEEEQFRAFNPSGAKPQDAKAIAEGDSDMHVIEDKASVGGYIWSYRAQNGNATIVAGEKEWLSRPVSPRSRTSSKSGKDEENIIPCAVSPCPIGHVEIPALVDGAKVTRIGRGAFSDCTALTAVKIPENVTCIEEDAFLGCTGLRSVTVPASVRIIRQDAFKNCTALTSVTLPAGLKNVERGAFFNCCALTSVMLPAGLSRIGEEVFSQCKALTSVAIPQGVQSIDQNAFRDCRALAAVTISSSVTNVSSAAFRYTDALRSFRVEEGNRFYKSENGLLLTKDGKTLVHGVNGDVTIPSGVINIGSQAFYGCSALRSIVIPSTVRNIGECAFSSCDQLTAVTIPSTVSKIDRSAFEYCSKLDAVNVLKNDRVESLPYDEFCKQWRLPGRCRDRYSDRVRLESEKHRSDYEKRVCAHGSSIEAGDLFSGWLLKAEGTNACSAGFLDVHRGQTNVVCINMKRGAPAVLSRTMTLSGNNPCLFLRVASWDERTGFFLTVRVNGKDILSNRDIRTYDFEPWNDIVVSLSDWRGEMVKTEVVFSADNWELDSPCLARVEVAEGSSDMRLIEGKEIVDGYTWSYRAQNGEAMIVAEKDGEFSCAVSPCPLGHLVIPSTLGGAKVTCIGREALHGCRALTSVTIPESVTRIEGRAFSYCTGLNLMKLPPNLKGIGKYAFDNCTALTSITMPEGLEVVGEGAFDDCSALSSVIMPKSVIYIGHRAFSGCKALTTVEIPRNLTDIVWWTFRDCHALASVTIPESVTNVDYTAFLNTGALMSFCVEEGNRYYKSVNGLLLTKDGTKLVHGVNGDVTIPFGVTDIGSLAFDGCSALRSIAIPSGVRDIGYHAFSACRGLTAVTMPSTVTQIGYGAFGNCAALISVALSSSVTNVGDGAFRNCAELSAVTVPSSVTNVGRKVFENCSKLKSVCVPRGENTETLSFDEWNKRVHWRWQKTIDGCVWSYHPVNGEAKIVDTAHWIPGPRCAVSPRPIGAVAIPSTIDGLPVTGIGGCALADCSELTSVVIPLSVKTVQRRAFENCTALTSVTLPATVTNIDEEVFGNCSQLKSVNVLKDGKSETVSLEEFCERWKLKRPRIPERSFRPVRRLGNTRPVPASATQRRESVKSE